MQVPGRDLNLRQGWALLKDSVNAWSDDYAPSMGAALSYYTLFSIAPLLLIAVSVAGLVFGPEAARGEIFDQLKDLMGAEGAQAVERLLQNANRPREGMIGTITGAAVLLLGATSVFNELQNDLDRIWRVPEQAKAGGLWSLLRSRLLSFGMVLGVAFLLMVSLLMSAALAALGKWWAPAFAGWQPLAHLVDLAVSFSLMTVVFAMIYKFMPRARIRWRDVWTGAAVTSALFAVGKFAIGLYLGRAGIGSAFGAAGSLVVVMVWVYYSAQIFLLGAEFTRLHAHAHGSRQGHEQAAAPISRAPLRPARPVPVFSVKQSRLRARPLLALGGAAAVGIAAGVLALFVKRR
jgi:membrane protein